MLKSWEEPTKYMYESTKSINNIWICSTLHPSPPGYWRLLDLDYRDQVFQRVLTLLEEEDWSYKRVPLNAACQKLEELEPG